MNNLNKDIFCDSFCGAGGVTEAIQSSNVGEVRVAINHDPRAIAAHLRNHPEVIHLNDDIRQVDPFPFILELAEEEDLHPAGSCRLCGPYRVDNRYRMLKKVELMRAMGFPEDYQLDPNSDTISKKFIGNSVEINVVRALIQANSPQQISMAI